MRNWKLAAILLTMAVGGTITGCQSDSDTNSGTTQEAESFANNDTTTVAQSILESLLGSNTDAKEIRYNLNLSTQIGTLLPVTIEIEENEAVGADGTLTGKNEAATDVIIKVTTAQECTYTYSFTVLPWDEILSARMEDASKELLRNTDNIRGHITLPETAGIDNDILVTWKSDRPDVITDTADGDIPAGFVTRQETDTQVTLTATLQLADDTMTTEIPVTVKAKPEEQTYSAYVYTYFRGNIYGTGESQHIHMATSQDGFHWSALNDNEPILKAELGTGGMRDSFLLRSYEGDHFYIIGTDLDANGGDWADYGNNGSKYIRVWESDDLVNWSEERLIEIAPENAACMWAPEAFYDDTTGEYVVYWATGLKGGDGKKIYYAKTRDFYTFTEPEIYKDVEDGITFIDTTMTEYEGTYYRFTKNENEISILMETSDSVLGDFKLVKTRIAGELGVEGPAIYKINGQEKWVLYMDGYAGDNAGVGYFPLIADSLEDLKTANFRKLNADEYEMPEGAKHGSFVPITQEEYDALQAKWGE
jgi:hypothetical protein